MSQNIHTGATACLDFPWVDLTLLSPEPTAQEKRECCAEFIEFAPSYLKSNVTAIIDEYSVRLLDERLHQCRLVNDQICSHAGLAMFVIPEFASSFMAAFHVVPAEYHNLIGITLRYTMNYSADGREGVYLFLRELQTMDPALAILRAVNRFTLPVEVIGSAAMSDDSIELKNLLLKIQKADYSLEQNCLAAQALPQFASSIEECREQVEAQIQDAFPYMKCAGVINLLRLFPKHPGLNKLIWQVLCDPNWTKFSELSEFALSGTGFWENQFIDEFEKRASSTLSMEQLAAASKRHSEFWQLQPGRLDRGNREIVAEAMLRLYGAAGAEPPQAVVWIDNPETAGLAAAMLGLPNARSHGCSKVSSYISRLLLASRKLFRNNQEIFDSWSWAWQQSDPRRFISLSIQLGERWQRNVPRSQFEPQWKVICKLFEGTQVESDLLQRSIPDQMHNDGDWSYDQARSLNILFTAGYRAFLKEIGLCEVNDGLEEIMANCGGFLPFDNIVIVYDRPSGLQLDDNNLAHASDGPAIEFHDGWKRYFLNGVHVPEILVKEPEKITTEIIDSTWNIEVRNKMIDLYGVDNYIKDSNCEAIQEDNYGVLYHKSFSESWRDNIRVVKVINKSPEPDGTFNVYFLQVPPWCKTAKEAVAWTFDMREEDYDPIVET